MFTCKELLLCQPGKFLAESIAVIGPQTHIDYDRIAFGVYNGSFPLVASIWLCSGHVNVLGPLEDVTESGSTN